MTKSGGTARAGGILLAGSLVSKVLRLGHDVLLARVLGPAGFGVIAAATSLVGILGELALVGSHRAALRFASLDARAAGQRSILRRAMVLPLALGAAFVAAITIAREPLTRLLFGDAVSPWILPAFALSVPAIGVFTVAQFVARAQRRFVVDTFVGDVCRMGLPFAATLMAFAWKRSLEAAAAGFVVGIAATALVALVAARRGNRVASGGASAGAPETTAAPSAPPAPSLARLFQVGAPLALGSASILLLNELDKVMLAAFRPEEEVGVYNAAFRIARQTLIVMPALNAAISPSVAPLLASGRIGELRTLYRRTVRWSLAAGWSATLLFCGFSADFLGLFGDDYRAGAHVLVVLCLGHLVNAAAGTVSVVIQYSGNEKKELLNGVVVIATCIVLNCALIPPFGAVGAAYSSFLALALVNSMRMVQAWKILDVMPYDRGTLGVLAAGAGGLILGLGARAAAAASGVPDTPLFGAATAGAAMVFSWVVYFAAAGVSEDEARLLRLPRRWVRVKRPTQDDRTKDSVASGDAPGDATATHLSSRRNLPAATSRPESAFAPRTRSRASDTR